jgi:hypothetical protein
MKITRRQLAAAAGSAAASSMLAIAQTPPNAPTAKPTTPEDDLTSAKDQTRRNSEALVKFQIAMSTEPAFKFTV